MCRKIHVRGYCLMAFGLGLMVGHWIDTWFFCSVGGITLVVLGLGFLKKR